MLLLVLPAKNFSKHQDTEMHAALVAEYNEESCSVRVQKKIFDTGNFTQRARNVCKSTSVPD